MNLFLLNVLIMLGWGLLTGGFSLSNLGLGFLIGLGAVLLSWPAMPSSKYFGRLPTALGIVLLKLPRFFEMIGFVGYQLFLSSLYLALDVLTPRDRSKPVILEVPLDARSDLEIMLLANLISLTPGTVSVEVSADRGRLFVHAMYAQHPDEVIDSIKRGLETRVLRLLRTSRPTAVVGSHTATTHTPSAASVASAAASVASDAEANDKEVGR